MKRRITGAEQEVAADRDTATQARFIFPCAADELRCYAAFDGARAFLAVVVVGQ